MSRLLLLLGLCGLFSVLLVVGIALAIFLTKKEKEQRKKVSSEIEKINALQQKGKITEEEAEELKKVIGISNILTERKSEPDVHIKVVGIINIIQGSFSIAILAVMLLLFQYSQHIVGKFNEVTFNCNSMFSHSPFPPNSILFNVVVVCIIVIIVLVLILTIIPLFTGINLLKLKNWARILSIIIASMETFYFPIGTAVGVYSLWVLAFREGASDHFLTEEKK